MLLDRSGSWPILIENSLRENQNYGRIWVGKVLILRRISGMKVLHREWSRIESKLCYLTEFPLRMEDLFPQENIIFFAKKYPVSFLLPSIVFSFLLPSIVFLPPTTILIYVSMLVSKLNHTCLPFSCKQN